MATAYPPQTTRTDAAGRDESKRLVSLDAYRGFIMAMLAASGFGIARLAQLSEDKPVWGRARLRHLATDRDLLRAPALAEPIRSAQRDFLGLDPAGIYVHGRRCDALLVRQAKSIGTLEAEAIWACCVASSCARSNGSVPGVAKHGRNELGIYQRVSANRTRLSLPLPLVASATGSADWGVRP